VGDRFTTSKKPAGKSIQIVAKTHPSTRGDMSSKSELGQVFGPTSWVDFNKTTIRAFCGKLAGLAPNSCDNSLHIIFGDV